MSNIKTIGVAGAVLCLLFSTNKGTLARSYLAGETAAGPTTPRNDPPAR